MSDTQPLTGSSVVVTSARPTTDDLAERLRELGANVVEMATIEIAGPSDGGAALRRALGNLSDYDWLVFTSANAVDRFVDELGSRSIDALGVAAVGKSTAASLRGAGIAVDLVPPEFVAESLVESFPPGPGAILLPQASVARNVVPDGLRAKGWYVEVVEAYQTLEVRPSAELVAKAAEADVITFASSSAVTNYLAVAGSRDVPPTVVCIGPITAATAVRSGMRVTVVAEEHTAEGMVRAIVEWRSQAT